jgi:hypothetical protein
VLVVAAAGSGAALAARQAASPAQVVRAWSHALNLNRNAAAGALATFVLGHRPQHRCDAPGGKAAALFVVRNGKIVLWQQVPVPADSGPTA